MPHHALIAGATGIVGRALARHLSMQPGWRVSGCARRVLQSAANIEWIHLDLADTPAVSAALQSRGITHVFDFLTWRRGRSNR